MTLFSPFIELTVGNTKIRNQFSKFDMWLSRSEPADICEIALKRGLPDIGIKQDMPVSVAVGYDLTKRYDIFSGFVQASKHPHYMFKDHCLKMFKTQIRETFIDVIPQDVIKHGLRQAGITDYKLDEKLYVRKPRFIVAGENVSEMIRAVNQTWQLNNDWYFTGKTFHWDQLQLSGESTYSYRYGENIIDLQFTTDRDVYGQRTTGKSSGAGKLITIISPFIKHSTEIQIIWPGVSNTRYWVETVRHYLNNNGALRTDILFRELI